MTKTLTRTTRGWPPEVRTRAVAHAVDNGLAAAHRETGVPKSTIARWLDADGAVVRSEVAARSTSKAREAAAASAARRATLRAEALEQIVDKLSVAANRALDATLAALAGGVPEGQSQRHPALALCQPRELVAIWTRAVHDLQLLTGEDTERGAAPVGPGIVQVFLAQIPDDGDVPVIIDVTPEASIETR